jgi:aminoglycoside phosphotransferase (APT) family kinase protein
MTRLPATDSLTVSNDTLPASIDELDIAWFADALRSALPDAQLSGVENEVINWGTATKALFRLKYHSAGPDAPEQICVKGGFDAAMAEFGLGTAYRNEAEFFGRIAPHLDIPLPKAWYAGVNVEQDQGIVIMENLAAAGARFGDCTQPWSPDLVAQALGVLAGLHGPTWPSQNRYPWLSTVSPVRDVMEVLFSDQHWESLFADGQGPQIPDTYMDSAKMHAALKALWRMEDASECTVTHGDAHLGNTYIDADGRPAFLDWQCVHAAPYMHDVAYFMTGALSVADRRTHERNLLGEYLGRLAASDGPTIGFDHAWQDYRQHTLYGYIWVLTNPKMQPQERINAMSERHVTAIDDHDSITAVLSDPRSGA